jgi:tetratricopeptide (TPR) repeat protein
MQEIKAFVAHSFSEDDKAMIQIFIDHFDSLAGSLPGFSWDHALQAEPSSVSGKVLAKIEDKNVFIGICSRTEYVVPPAGPHPIPFLNQVRVKNSDVQWKTSDWIIQEIGLAVGRGMKVIIFLEEGVRKPGGLFSDIEYILFKRDNPPASFDKLLQMLGSFMPKATPATSAIEAKPALSDKSKEEDQSAEDDGLEPKLSWDEDAYDHAAFRAIVLKKDADAFEKIDTAFRASPLSKGTALTAWEATVEWYRSLANQKADFGKIKSAVEADPKNTRLLSYLAIGYSEYDEHLVAAQTYEKIAEYSTTEEEKARNLIYAAREYRSAGKMGVAGGIIEKLKAAAAGNSQVASTLLSYFRDKADEDKEQLFRLVVLEQIAALDPMNVKARFDLAYQYSQVDSYDMALFHYGKIPPFARDSATWNNLGVAYGHFLMRAKSVTAFRESANANETLAMSNLGFKFLNAGFLAEAKAEAEKAFEVKDRHETVPELLKRIKELPDEEDKRLKETLDKVQSKAEFFRKAADEVLKTNPTTISLKWNSPDEGILDAKIEGDLVRLFGEQLLPMPQNPFTYGLLTQPTGLGTVMTPHRVEYSGRVHGNVIVGEVKRSTDGAATSLLAAGGGSTKIMMIFSEDRSQLHVAEGPDTINPKFYTLTGVVSKQ